MVMKASEIYEKNKGIYEQKQGSGKFIDNKFKLWCFLKTKNLKNEIIKFIPLDIDDAIGYYARYENNHLKPITEKKYDDIKAKRKKEKQVHGDYITENASIRYVMHIIVLPDEQLEITEPVYLVNECSGSEYRAIADMPKNVMESDFGEYFEEIGKYPADMLLIMKRKPATKPKTPPSFEYSFKAGAKGVKFHEVDIDLDVYREQKFNLPDYYSAEEEGATSTKIEPDMEVYTG